MSNSTGNKLHRLYNWASTPKFLITLAVLITIPSLPSGLFGDDLIHREMILKFTAENSLIDSFLKTCLYLFNFNDDSATSFQNLVTHGYIPWWTHTDSVVSFWRPMAAATHWLDYQFWPNSPWLMHLHSAVYFLIFCFCFYLFVGRIENRIIQKPILALILILFLIDFSHLFSFFWVANRNILMAIMFAMLTLLSHHQWRAKNKWDALFVATVFLFFALLSAEGGLATTAYLFSYALLLDRSSLTKRILSLLPYVVVVIFWRWSYHRLGFGEGSNGLYLDPINNTQLFIESFIINGPALLFASLTAIDTFHLTLAPKWKLMYAVFCFVASVFFIYLTRKTLFQHPLARFGLLAATISIIPLCAMSAPGGRLLFFPSIGAAIYLGYVIYDWYQELESSWNFKMIILKGRFALLVFVHLIVMFPLVALISTVGAINGAGTLNKAANFTPWLEDDDQTVIIINPPNSFSMIYTPSYSNYHEMIQPAFVIQLLPGYSALEFKRINRTDFLVTADSPILIERDASLNYTDTSATTHHVSHYNRAMDTIFLNEPRPWVKGQIIQTGFSRIEIREIKEGLPTKLRISFKPDFQLDQAIWLYWDWSNQSYVRLDPLSGGEKLKIDGPY